MSWIEQTISLVQKALTGGTPRGSVSDYIPGIAPSYGRQNRLNNNGFTTVAITPQRMREVVMQTPTAAAAMNAALDYATGVKIAVRNSDPSQKAPTRAARLINSKLAKPNPSKNGRKFRRAIFRDLFTLGYAAAELVGNDLYAVDAAKITLDFDEHGRILGYNQLSALGQPIPGTDGVHTWTTDELIWYTLDDTSESPFPTSRIGQLFACSVIEALMMQFIGARFTDSNIPFGVLDIGDVSEDELKDAITIWNNQIVTEQHPEHRLMFTGSKGGANYIKFGYDLNELSAPQLLAAVRLYILGILGVTPNELGQSDDVNKANGYNLSYTFKKRAIEPLLDEFVAATTDVWVHGRLGFTQCELYYEEIDSRDELLQAQIDDIYLKMGVWSINHVRNRKGLPDVSGGEEPYLILGANAVPLSLLHAIAQTQLDALQVTVLAERASVMQAIAGMAAGDPNAQVPQLSSPPILRGMQPPEKFTTIDGSGSSTTKFQMARPDLKPQGAPTAPRGPVQANRNQGVRKENT